MCWFATQSYFYRFFSMWKRSSHNNGMLDTRSPWSKHHCENTYNIVVAVFSAISTNAAICKVVFSMHEAWLRPYIRHVSLHSAIWIFKRCPCSRCVARFYHKNNVRTWRNFTERSCSPMKVLFEWDEFQLNRIWWSNWHKHQDGTYWTELTVKKGFYSSWLVRECIITCISGGA